MLNISYAYLLYIYYIGLLIFKDVKYYYITVAYRVRKSRKERKENLAV